MDQSFVSAYVCGPPWDPMFHVGWFDAGSGQATLVLDDDGIPGRSVVCLRVGDDGVPVLERTFSKEPWQEWPGEQGDPRILALVGEYRIGLSKDNGDDKDVQTALAREKALWRWFREHYTDWAPLRRGLRVPTPDLEAFMTEAGFRDPGGG